MRVEWVDGEQSLLRLPEKLFEHLRLTLGSLQVSSEVPTPAEPEPKAALSSTDQVLAQIARLIGDRRAASAPAAAENNVAAQLLQLAALRDQGALTDEEFAAAKARLLD